MDQSTDRIERKILIQAPRARVWRALSQAEEFGRWFGVELKGQAFAPGRHAQGRITHPGYEHLQFDMVVERIEPETLLSWRWHPYAVEQGVDYTREEPTLVTFTLEDAAGGTLLTVVESGFDKVPPHRRLEAFRMNSEGWEAQMQNIQNHVAAGA
ncbi:MAG: SRPBCC family protein [Pseudomonadota bacterium]